MGLGETVFEHALAALYFAALRRCLAECRLHAVKAGAIDQRADQCAGFERAADRHRGIGALQPRQQRVVEAVMDEEPAQGGAALAGRADCSEQDGADGEVEIGRGCDDHAVIAAELEQRPGERWASTGPTWRPMRVEPVAEISGTRRSPTSASPASRPPISRVERLAGAPSNRAQARSTGPGSPAQ